VADPNAKLTLSSVEPETLQSTAPLSALKQIASSKQDDVLVTVGAKRAPAVTGTFKLPMFPETIEEGFIRGKKIDPPLVCCTVQNKKMEKFTAYDFFLMWTAAARDGVTLKINEGFRTNQRQLDLVRERSNAAVAKDQGGAAPAGFSHHQSGKAVDISMGLAVSQTRVKDGEEPAAWLANPIFKWLFDNAINYGFDHKEGNIVGEPWHWTHLGSFIVGIAPLQAATGSTILIADAAIAASAVNQPGLHRQAYAASYDTVSSVARSQTMTSNDIRQISYNELSSSQAQQGAALSSQANQVVAATLETLPTSFRPDTLSTLSYNFKTGLWGDGLPL